MMKFYSKETTCWRSMPCTPEHFERVISHINNYVDVHKYQDNVWRKQNRAGTCTVFENSKDKILWIPLCVWMEPASGRIFFRSVMQITAPQTSMRRVYAILWRLIAGPDAV